MALNTIPEILEDIRAGRMVVILDDEDRENEGDFIMAAEAVTAEKIAFIVRHSSGIICQPMLHERLEALQLPQMVTQNSESHRTAFAISVDYRHGTTTGISAHDRAKTIKALADPASKSGDFARPGHIFPLSYAAGGVLTRAGHTEATIDLVRLAGLTSLSGILCEIVNDDGTMKRRPELEAFAQEHDLKIGTIADLIRFRLETEKTVLRVHEENVDTEFGPFRLVAYRDVIHHGLHYALVRGTVDDGAPVLSRVHVRNTLSDVLHLQRDDLGLTVTSALRRIADEDRGVLLVLSGEDTTEALLARLNRQPTTQAPEEAQQQEWRQHGLGAQMLVDLGVHRLRVLGTPRKLVGLAGFGLEVVEYV